VAEDTDAWGQPVGPVVTGWERRPPITPVELTGRYATLEPLDVPRHVDDLHAANGADDGRMWTYLPYGPFPDLLAYRTWMEGFAGDDQLVAFAIVDRRRATAAGVVAYARIVPDDGACEIAHVALSPGVRRSAVATDALALLLRHAFDLGYRRCEWKCDALNEPSRRAACRLGFTYEGTFRQAKVVRGRNRDTAWFAMTDADWPPVRSALDAWLDPANFDAEGRQRRALSALTRQALGR
jgi:RimJ/RimL family protein N-acetyltransferase